MAIPRALEGETILVVEDEMAMLKMTMMMLRGLGYGVLTSNLPGQAIELACECPGQTHLLITDVIMPEMNGRDLAQKLLPLYPDIKHLFMSGYTSNVIAHHGILEEGVIFIQKPFTLKDLAIKVRQTLSDN